MRVECAHGDGNTEGSRATRRAVDTAGLAGERRESSVLSALEPTAGGMPLRRVRGGAVPAVLCGEAGASQLGAGGDRERGGEGKRGDLGGCRIIKKKKEREKRRGGYGNKKRHIRCDISKL